MAFIRADLADLNKKAGITSLPPRHYDRKRGNILCNRMYSHTWSTNKGYMQNIALLCPLVEHCGCPCEAKIEETPGQFILYIHVDIPQLTTRTTVPDTFLSTSKTLFARL